MLPILNTNASYQSEFLVPQANGTATLLDSSDDESAGMFFHNLFPFQSESLIIQKLF